MPSHPDRVRRNYRWSREELLADPGVQQSIREFYQAFGLSPSDEWIARELAYVAQVESDTAANASRQ